MRKNEFVLNTCNLQLPCSYDTDLLDNNNRATVTRHNYSKWPRKCESKIKWFRNLLRIQRVSLKTVQINLSDVSRLGVYRRFFVDINVGQIFGQNVGMSNLFNASCLVV